MSGLLLAAPAGMMTTSQPSLLEVALERWEDDGGTDAPGGFAIARPREPMPPLAAGYTAQPEGIFFDPTGRVSYRFNRVYRPATLAPGHDTRLFSILDEDLSFWSSSFSLSDSRGGTRNAGRWLTFASARERMTPRPSFATFSQVTTMRNCLVELIGPSPTPDR
ncbi:MAG: hypothetical protein ABI321_15630 [Polyangia bacterium]